MRTIIMNRPAAFNALDLALGDGLVRALEACFDPAVRAVVLTGLGRSFCAGGDLRAMQEAGAGNISDFTRDLTKPLHRIITDIRLLPTPVIAAAKTRDAAEGIEAFFAKRQPDFQGK